MRQVIRSESDDIGTFVGSPVVVGANWYRFRPGEYLHNPHVMSVCFIWVVRGGGQIKVAGQTYRLATNQVFRLPWSHEVEYQADTKNPFRIGTLHIVPRHSESLPVIPRVAHLAGDSLLDDPARQGDPKEFKPSLADFKSGPARRIADLGRFAVERFTEAAFHEESARALARMVLAENAEWDKWESIPTLPVALEDMISYSRANISAQLSVSELAKAGDCSSTTAQRLFNQYFGVSLGNWVRQLKLQEAAHLLRTSGLRVNEVAELVGFKDALYFSRVFSEEYGVAPSLFAQGELRP
ncbi:MAG: AraC family transcriptional regulator [Micrococcales bacterium]